MSKPKFNLSKLSQNQDRLEETDIQESKAIIEKATNPNNQSGIIKDGRPTHMPDSEAKKKINIKTTASTIEFLDLVLAGDLKEKFLSRSHFIEIAILEKLQNDTEGRYKREKNRHWWFKGQ